MAIDLYSKGTTDTLLAAKLSISSLSNGATTTLNATAPTSGQVLSFDGTDLVWATGGGGGSVAWGSITGTLSDQTDLWTVLGGKADLTGSSFTGTQYFTGSWGQVQIGDSSSGIAIYDGSYSTYVGVTLTGVRFADGTTQTTAATAGANFGDVFGMSIVTNAYYNGSGWTVVCNPVNNYLVSAGGMAVVNFDGSIFEWMSGMSSSSSWTFNTSSAFGPYDYLYIQCLSQKSQNPINYV